MEINKEILNSLKRGDLIKYKKRDFKSDWKIIRGFYQRDGIDYIAIVSSDFPKEPIEIEACYIVDIKKCSSTSTIMDNILSDTNFWIINLSETLANNWVSGDNIYQRIQEQIMKDMDGKLNKSVKSETFKSITEGLLNTYIKKNADYGSSFDKSMDEFGLTAAVVRMSDKMERLKSLSKKDAQVKDESVEDTLLDLANYCIMTVMHLKINEDEE